VLTITTNVCQTLFHLLYKSCAGIAEKFFFSILADYMWQLISKQDPLV